MIAFGEAPAPAVVNLAGEQAQYYDGVPVEWFYLLGAVLIAGVVANIVLILFWRARVVQWREKAHRILWRPWRWKDVWWMVAALLLVGLMSDVALAYLVSPRWKAFLLESSPFETERFTFQFLRFHVVGLLFLWALLRMRRMSWAVAFGLDARRLPRAVWVAVIALLAYLPVALFYSSVYQMLLKLVGYEGGVQDVLVNISKETRWSGRVVFFIAAGVLAPLFEEMFFRGMLLPVLSKRLRVEWAVVAVSLLFALVHWDVSQFVTLFLLSVTFCLAYIYSETLWAPMVMHGLYNSIVVAATIYFSL